MIHRRFGRTELRMPVFSCGGMRYQQAWMADAEIEPEGQRNVEAIVRRALELDIDHLETARGYGTSELQLGRVLPSIPRDDYILQTKVQPKYNAAEFRAEFAKSLSLLGVERVDLLALHGVNDEESYRQAFDCGCLDAALEFKRQGRARAVGFSTHGPTDLIVRAIESDAFDYVNLHWYWILQSNGPALEAAAARDMGVFIISPSEKGGKLFEPPDKLVELCAPLSPMRFNDLFCLSRPEIHTLSVGAARPTDFDEHVAALEHWDDRQAVVAPVDARLRAAMAEALGADWVERWSEGLPDWTRTPGRINIGSILWLWNLARGLDMVEFGKFRYNLLGNGGSWFPGQHAGALVSGEVSEDDIRRAAAQSPFADRIVDILKEAHALLSDEEAKRLSQP